MNTNKKCKSIYTRRCWTGFFVSDGGDIPFTQWDLWFKWWFHEDIPFEEVKKTIEECEKYNLPYPDYLELLIPY